MGTDGVGATSAGGGWRLALIVRRFELFLLSPEAKTGQDMQTQANDSVEWATAGIEWDVPPNRLPNDAV